MTYSIPDSLDDAIALARDHTDVAFVAGGTDLMVRRAQGHTTAAHLIDLSRITALRSIAVSEKSVTIGAGTTLVEIIRHPLLRERYPALVDATCSVASPLIRTSATIGGNLLCENRCLYFDQSDFWREAVGRCLKCGGDVCIATGGTKGCFSVFISDIAPVLICLGARVEFVDAEETNAVPIEDLYSGDGLHPRTLPAGAILTRIVIPLPSQGSMFFRKVRPRESVDFTNLTLAMRIADDTLTVAASGVGPAPAVAHLPDVPSADTLVSLLLPHTQIIDNLPYNRLYRREMLHTLMRDALVTCRR